MVFTLKAEVVTQDGKAISRNTKEFVADDLHSALDSISEFLRGCGYSVGYLTDADEPADAHLTPLVQPAEPAPPVPPQE
jgi:hypothetical protein